MSDENNEIDPIGASGSGDDDDDDVNGGFVVHVEKPASHALDFDLALALKLFIVGYLALLLAGITRSVFERKR